MSWDQDCQRIEAALRAGGAVAPDPSWTDLRGSWDERLADAHRRWRAGIDEPLPLHRFERASVLFSAFHDSEVAEQVMALASEEAPWLEPALASLAFSGAIRPTLRPWELVPTGSAAAIERAQRAIDRGMVCMGHPLIFIDGPSLWVLWGEELECAYEDLDAFLAALEDSEE